MRAIQGGEGIINAVIESGKSIFGEKFISIRFMSLGITLNLNHL